jgi:hypothetical protein
MLFGHVIFAMLSSRAPTIELRAICWDLSVDWEHVNRLPNKKNMIREDAIGSGKVASTSKTHKDEDPLLFLRKPSSGRGSGTAF